MFAVIGGDQTLSMPLIDTKTNGPLMLEIGPKNQTHNFRWFVRLPSLEDSERMPCPFGYDRTTIRFDPILLYIDAPTPVGANFHLYQVSSGPFSSRLPKTSSERWTATRETVRWPALLLNLESMAPDSAIEFHGVSGWKFSNRTRGIWPHGPPSLQAHAISVMCLFKMTWLPKEKGKVQIQYVSGSAVDRPQNAPVPVQPVPDLEKEELPPEAPPPVPDVDPLSKPRRSPFRDLFKD